MDICDGHIPSVWSGEKYVILYWNQDTLEGLVVAGG